MKSICDHLVPVGIHHICHNSGISKFCHDNPFGVSDLSTASDICTECSVRDGVISMDELLDGSFNAMDLEAVYKRHEPGRIIYRNLQALRGKYEMAYKHEWSSPTCATCFLSHGSGPVKEDNICFHCDLEIDAPRPK